MERPSWSLLAHSSRVQSLWLKHDVSGYIESTVRKQRVINASAQIPSFTSSGPGSPAQGIVLSTAKLDLPTSSSSPR